VTSNREMVSSLFASLTKVLYSRHSYVWKIADFGLTVEGTSKNPRTTINSMGTSGYRAPELIRGIKHTFTNKVDVWACGCIFFELMFRQKAFTGDFETHYYSFDGNLDIPQSSADDIWGEVSREVVVTALERMLEKDPTKRPAAKELWQEFHSSAGRPSQLFAKSTQSYGSTVETNYAANMKEFGEYEVLAGSSYGDIATELHGEMKIASKFP
jgi:serine/threonine protein kinase